MTTVFSGLRTWLRKQGGVKFSLFASLVFFLPFDRVLSYDINLGTLSYTFRISHVMALLLISVYVFDTLKRRVRHKFTLLDYLLITFLALYGVAVVFANHISQAVITWVYCGYVIALAFAISRLYRKEWLARVEPYLAATTWISIIFGLYQYIGDSLGWSTYVTALREIYNHTILGFPRIQAFGLEPLYYANFLLIPFSIYSVLYILKKKQRPYLLIAIVSQLILSVSRGALISTLIGMAVIVAFVVVRRGIPAKAQMLFRYICLVAVGFLLALSMILGAGKLVEVFSLSEQTVSTEQKVRATFTQATNLDLQVDRTLNRELAWKGFLARPILGWGPGGFNRYAHEVYPPYATLPGVIIVNNELVELLFEAGVVTTVVLVLFYAVLIVLTGRRFISGGLDNPATAVALGLLAYLVALGVQYQTFSTLYILHIWTAVGVAMGILLADNKQKVLTKKS